MLATVEAIIFFISFFYIIYHFCSQIFVKYKKAKRNITSGNIRDKKSSLNKINVKKKEEKSSNHIEEADMQEKIAQEKALTNNEKVEQKIEKVEPKEKIEEKQKPKQTEEVSQLSEILKRVRVNASKGYFDTAKTLIVEGLSIDKKHKDLNLELASIYEKEQKYQSAEYIYKDLLDFYPNDVVIMKKLAFSYAMQGKLDLSLKTYEDIHKKKVGDDEVIDMLSEITYEIKDYVKAVKYITLFLRSKPRDVEKLTMKAEALEKLSKLTDSLEVHKKILELQPYNTFSRDKKKELEQYVIK